MIFKLKRSTRILLSLALALAMILPHVDQPVAKAAGEDVYDVYVVQKEEDGSGYKILNNQYTDVTPTLVKNPSVPSVDKMTAPAGDNSETIYTLQIPFKAGLSFADWRTHPFTEFYSITGLKVIRAANNNISLEPVGDDQSFHFSTGTGGNEYYLFARYTPSTPSSSTTYINTSYYYYNVAFNANGGSGKMDGITMAAGSTLPLPACEFKGPKGSDFIGWEYDGKIYQPGEIVSFDRNKTYNATWGEKMILSGDPVWKWTPPDSNATIPDGEASAVKAEVTVTYESTSDPTKRFSKTYKDENITITRDKTVLSALAFTAQVTGVTDVYFDKNDPTKPIKATDLNSVKKYGIDVMYDPQVKWTTKWPDKWTKGTDYPQMKYTITYTSKNTGKKVTTDPIDAKVTSDPASIATNQNNAFFIATADLSEFYTDESGTKKAADVVDKCAYVFPKAGDIGYARQLLYKGYKAKWDDELSNTGTDTQTSTSSDDNSKDTFKAPDMKADLVYMTYGKKVTDGTTATLSEAEATQGESQAEPLERFEDLVINTDVTLKKEELFDGKVTRYIASFTTLEGEKLTEYKAYDTDPESKTYGKALNGIKIYGIEKEYSYTDSTIKPIPIVVDYDIDGGRRLKNGTDYNVTYKKNVKINSTAKVVISGKGNYYGTLATESFKIVQRFDDSKPKNTNYIHSVVNVRVDKVDESFVYDGEVHFPQKITVEAKDSNSKKTEDQVFVYKEGEGYENQNPNGMNAYICVTKIVDSGKGRVCVKGTDGKEKSDFFTIKKVSFKDATKGSNGDLQVSLPDGYEYQYTGSSITPRVKVVYKRKELREGDDYKVTISGGTKKPGKTGSVIIKGVGSFTGEYKNAVEFNIVKFDISKLNPDRVFLSNCSCRERADKIGILAAITDDGVDVSKLIDKKSITISQGGEELNKKTKPTAGKTYTVKASAGKYATGSIELTATVSTDKKKIGLSKMSFPYCGNPVEPERILDDDNKNPFEKGALEVKYGIDCMAYSYKNVNTGTAYVILNPIGVSKYIATQNKFKITRKKV